MYVMNGNIGLMFEVLEIKVLFFNNATRTPKFGAFCIFLSKNCIAKILQVLKFALV